MPLQKDVRCHIVFLPVAFADFTLRLLKAFTQPGRRKAEIVFRARMVDIRKHCLQIDIPPGLYDAEKVSAKRLWVGYVFERIERNRHRKFISEALDLGVDGEINCIVLIGAELFLVVAAIEVFEIRE